MTNMLEKLSTDAAPKYQRGPDGWYTRDGYPVQPDGRPDWCCRCSRLSREYIAHDRNWRPGRCEPDSGLCAACQRVEREDRLNLRYRMQSALGAPVAAQQTAMKGRRREAR